MMNPRSDLTPERSAAHYGPRTPRGLPFDPSSSLFGAREIPCWECKQIMSGNAGIQVARRLAGSNIYLHVIMHAACADKD